MKYAPSLCKMCNSSRSQPWDRAYQSFADWVGANETNVLNQRHIDFCGVYGTDFAESQRNLFKYFTKALGCKIVEGGAEVPPDLFDVLALDQFWTKLRLTLSVDEDIIHALGAESRYFLANGPLHANLFKARPTRAKSLRWTQNLRWLRINYWYGVSPDRRTGSTWIANARHVKLGAIRHLAGER